MRRRSATVLLRTEYSRLPLLERFVDDFCGVGTDEPLRAKIVVGELFDNIVAHGRGVRPGIVAVTLYPGPPLRAALRYRCSNLAEFDEALHAARVAEAVRMNGSCANKVSAHGASASGDALRYDGGAGRFRGLALPMCLRLSSRIWISRGLLRHRVSVVF